MGAIFLMGAFFVRRMQPRDVEAGLRLTQAQRWSHRLEDWEFHFRLGRGWVVCDEQDGPVGTALWWPYGETFATIGLVVVEPQLQGKGIGRLLMNTVIEDAGPRVLQLIATQAGRKLYEQCGFRESGGIAQTHGVPTAATGAATSDALAVAAEVAVRRARREDLPSLCEFDAAAFGADRRRLVGAVFEVGEGVVAERGGRMVGFALKRQSGRGTLIGPVVASDENVAIAVVSRLVSEAQGFTRIDIPTNATKLAAWLEAAGLPRVDEVTTMIRPNPSGLVGAPEAPPAVAVPGARVFALASQAFS
jgi:GNAT superfamily N-acetyltransferase